MTCSATPLSWIRINEEVILYSVGASFGYTEVINERAAIFAMAVKENSNVVLALSELKYCDSTTLEFFKVLKNLLQKMDLKLCLLAPSVELEHLLSISALKSSFLIYSELDKFLADIHK